MAAEADGRAVGARQTTSHRLQLPHGTSAETVVTMIRNVVPDARLDEGGIDIGGGAVLIEDARRPSRWTLTTPRVRDSEPADDLPDSHGYGRAFADGMPFGDERAALDLAWSLARRLDGAVVTDSHTRLEPHPCHVRDLFVTSPNALIATDLLALVRTVEPDADLIEPPAEADTTGYMLRIPIAGSDDAQGVATAGAGAVLLTPAADEGADEILVRVGPTSRPTALEALPWLDGAVDYEVVHDVVDERDAEIEVPDDATAARWTEIYRRIGLVAGLIVETVGGYVVDLEGFLVDPVDLV